MKYYKEVGFNPLVRVPPAASCSCRSSSRWSTCCGRTSSSTSAARPLKRRAPGRRARRQCYGKSAVCNKLVAQHGELPVRQRHHGQGDGRRADRADRPLRRHDAFTQRDDVRRRRPQPAPDVDRPAGVLRDLRDPVRGRPARLLDRDEPRDDPAAVFMLRTYGRPWTCRSWSRPRRERRGASSRGKAGMQEADRAGGTVRRARTQEAVRQAPVSDADDELTPEEELRDLLETLVEAFGIDGEIAVTRGRRQLCGARSRARRRGAGRCRTARCSRRSSTSPSASCCAARRVCGSSSTPPATAGAARRRCARRPTGRGARASARGGEVALRPMPAAERRFVHEYLRERGDVATHSEGDEPRALVVSLVVARVSRFPDGETGRARCLAFHVFLDGETTSGRSATLRPWQSSARSNRASSSAS